MEVTSSKTNCVVPYALIWSRDWLRKSALFRPSFAMTLCISAEGALRYSLESKRTILRRTRENAMAAERPAGPPPITATSNLKAAIVEYVCLAQEKEENR
jgi:hypothetical protein